MTRTRLLLGILIVGWSPLLLAADRLTDRDVKELISRIEQGRDRFDDALDDKLKHGVIRGASGEVNVADFLNDFQQNIDRLEERLKPDYAASPEAAALLRQASGIHRFFREQPAGTRGESEWNRLETDFKTLASAYGTLFPLPDDASVRRIGDRELAAALDDLGRNADQLKKSIDNDLKKDPTVKPEARKALVAEADQLSKEAKTLRDRVKDGEPSSAEAERLLAQAARFHAMIGSYQVPTSTANWTDSIGRLETIASAYGMSWTGRPKT